METQETRPHFMQIALLHKCNFSCEHCGYIYLGDIDEHPIGPGYKLTFEQVQECIADCLSVKDDRGWTILITGGEPTLWEDGDKDYVDLLLECAKAGIPPSFNTNGSYWDDWDQCKAFFDRYFDNTDVRVGTLMSVDNFHRNYDKKTGRCQALDNAIRYKKSMPPERQNDFWLNAVAIVTKDPDSHLPKEMLDYYREMGAPIGEFPLLPIGKAKKINSDLLPDPPDLNRLSPPASEGDPGGVVLIGTDYYTANRETGEKIGNLGHLKDLFPNLDK